VRVIHLNLLLATDLGELMLAIELLPSTIESGRGLYRPLVICHLDC
jgi:hypothetical protein